MSRFLTPHSLGLPSTVPFTGPEALERASGQPLRARLGANENLFGPSPLALAAMQEAAAEVALYPDPESFALKSALAAEHGCKPENIVIGNGIDGLLGLLCRLTLAPGVKVVTSLGGYPTLNYHVQGYGGSLIRVPYRGDFEDPEALLGRAKAEAATLVYLANPDNPMGSHHPGTVIEAMVYALPPEALLILDEAYVELAPAGTAPQIPAEHPQVIRLRTFSKAYGLAGARVGYAICCAELARAFDKVRDHFGMGRLGVIGALAALEDRAWLARTCAQVDMARERLGRLARQNGLHPLASATNFVTVDCGRDGDYARRILAESLARGLFIRMPGVAPLDRCIRISLGPEASMDVVEAVLPEALRAAG